MATPLRKKRNFRGLQLAVSDPPTAPLPAPPLPGIQQLNLVDPQPLVIRKAPAAPQPPVTTHVAPPPPPQQQQQQQQQPMASGAAPAPPKPPGGKKRPPPMTLKAPKIPPSNINVVVSSHQPPPAAAVVVVDDGSSPDGTTYSSSSATTAPTTASSNGGGNTLTVISSSGGNNSAPNTASFVSGRRNTYHAHLSNALANLDVNDEIKFELRAEDLKDLQELGQGNGGSVKKVEHVPTGTIMAKKIVLIDAKPSVRKQILRELQIMHDCKSKYIISFYGAFLADPNICICMEFMDKGSLDGIYKKIGAIDVDVVAKVALAVLEGLTYLYDAHRIIHRDIKPSNILFNSHGEIKLIDFGVSGELINSIADTFVGTSTYMSPERIQGAQYTVKSDVWSLGISLIELALGHFPFADADSDSEDDESDLYDLESTLSPGKPNPYVSIPNGTTSSDATNGTSSSPSLDTLRKERAKERARERKESSSSSSKADKRKSKGVSLQGGGMTMSILELLQHIVNEPAPRLNNATSGEGKFPKMADLFIECCLLKDPERRWTPKDLLKHEWMDYARVADVDLEEWASTF